MNHRDTETRNVRHWYRVVYAYSDTGTNLACRFCATLLAFCIMDLQRILRETFIASAEHHASIGSTNDRARQCAAEGVALPRLITADCQTAGRGRGSNRWWTGDGSLALSLLLPADCVPSSPGQSILLSLATGVALVETLATTAGQAGGGSHELGLHWPNDVMLAGRKLAGVLIEALPNRMHVVGIGVNTNSTASDAPAEIGERLVTLRDVTGTVCDHTEVVVRLLKEWEALLRELRSAPERMAARADAMCLQRGRVLTIRRGEEDITGRCRGIAPDGALVLDTPAGPRVCHSGVVQPPPEADARP
jgi:BirA family transcriptional regulator, biotin operon repressor / biotin---[acetyl-CoA-carboxylase] ligase